MPDHEAVDWANLEYAYGSAAGVPDLLRRAEGAGSDFADEWNDLWSHLCHQGTVYTASYAALPTLVDMCLRHEPRGYVAPLQLVASILASNDAPEGAEQLRGRYAAETSRLHDFAERCAERATDDIEFAYAVETLAAFEDRGVWSRNLGYLADGELQRECHRCSAHLLIELDELPATVTVWTEQHAPTIVRPKHALDPYERRLVALAEGSGRPRVVERLPYVFGTLVCPECTVEQPVVDPSS